jgi:hypothetical protein
VSIFIRLEYLKMVITDDEIDKAWQRIRNVTLAAMKDGSYSFAVTSPSNTGVPNVNKFVSRNMTKEETYQHLTKIYEKMKQCPVSGNQIVQAPSLDKLAAIKKLI